ncbi:pre-mRNA-splicing regulator WTAP-like [Ptychodera flava]|uniref:pre-mRNA-splicing regulator WTAP-like n=1 Tax=Ptychodera flava TaxID=63121 RepID=UPI003969BBA6
MSEGEPAPKRVRLSQDDLKQMSKDELLARWSKQESYIDTLESRASHDSLGSNEELAGLRESEEKLKQQQQDSTRRENVLVMRLTTKEQEMQEYATQLTELKQNSSSAQLRSILLDPAINILFQRIKKELEEGKDKLEQAQSEMSAWKFTPDSQTGKKLMSRCRQLIQENQELGRQLSQGRIAQLEAELALQKKYSEELKSSQDELNDFVIQLDEEVEGMQSTIHTLQQQLKETKHQLSQLKAAAEGASTCSNSVKYNMDNTGKANAPNSLSEQNVERTTVNVNSGAKNWYENQQTATATTKDQVYQTQSTLNHTGTSDNDDEVEGMDTSSQESEETTRSSRTKSEVTYPDDNEVNRTTAKVFSELQENSEEISAFQNETRSEQTTAGGSEGCSQEEDALPTYHKHNNKSSSEYFSDADSPREIDIVSKDPFEVTSPVKRTGEGIDSVEHSEQNGLSKPTKISSATESD